MGGAGERAAGRRWHGGRGRGGGVGQDRHGRRRLAAAARRRPRPDRCGSGHGTRGCSTGPSCSPTPSWPRPWPPTRGRPRPTRPASRTCSCASKRPASCSGSTRARPRRWRERRRWPPGSWTCCATSNGSSGWDTSATQAVVSSCWTTGSCRSLATAWSCTAPPRASARRRWSRSGHQTPSVSRPVRTGFPCFCAALAGYVEATRDDDRERNRLCPPNTFSNGLASWADMQVRGARATRDLRGRARHRRLGEHLHAQPVAGRPRTP